MTALQNTPEIRYVTYRPELAPAFRDLNLEWLRGNDLLEPDDLVPLDDPEGTVLAGGGQVFFALDGDTAVGACAAIRCPDGTVELAKLAVAPAARGRGIGRHLCLLVLHFARSVGAASVTLLSNHRLAAAIRLYESLGFRHVPLPADLHYATADVAMELGLHPSGEAPARVVD
jgi:putative acetyltransferase